MPSLTQSLGLGALFCMLASAAFAQSQPHISKAKQAILIDHATGAVLFQKNADDLVAPASMSKLMTLTVIFDALRSGELSFETGFKVSENAWRTGGAPSRTSAMFAGLGKTIPLEDLIKGIAIQSGNDACIVVAEGMAGTESAFAERMTSKARDIGLVRSTFGNATGLPHPKQLMTVREIGALAEHIIETYPERYKYFSMRRFPYQPPGRRKPYAFFNRNPLLGMGIGADGLKTGYLKEAGYGLVASTVQKGQRLIAVVHGLANARQRRDEAAKMIEWGYSNFDSFSVFRSDELVGHARVWGGEAFHVPLRGKGDVRALLPKGADAQRLSFEIVYDGPLKAPIQQGDQVAVLRITTGTNSVNTVPLYAAEAVARGSIVRRGVDSILVLTMRWLGDQARSLLDKVML